MSRDFRRGGSAEDGAAPKRVYRRTGFRPAGAGNDGFRDREGRDYSRGRSRDDDFRSNSRDSFRGNSRDNGFKRGSRDENFRSSSRSNGFRNDRDGRGNSRDGGFRKSFSDRPSYERPEKREFRGETRKFGFDFKKRNDRPEYSRKEERRFIKTIENIEKRPAPKPRLPKKDTDEIRLNKFIANSGICSRREADTYIQAGLISVNGTIVTQLGTKIKPEDEVKFNGERVSGEQKVYIVMNKPKGYVTTTSDPHADKTVMELLRNCNQRVFPVGRLDKNTTGVLLFTNDGNLAETLSHPSYNKKKIYQVTLDRNLSQSDMDKIADGIWLPDGEIHADEISYADPSDRSIVGLEIHSGRNRIVRRIFESLGYKIKKLDRCYFAGLTKKGLRPGNWRYLTESEVGFLKMGSYE